MQLGHGGERPVGSVAEAVQVDRHVGGSLRDRPIESWRSSPTSRTRYDSTPTKRARSSSSNSSAGSSGGAEASVPRESPAEGRREVAARRRNRRIARRYARRSPDTRDNSHIASGGPGAQPLCGSTSSPVRRRTSRRSAGSDARAERWRRLWPAARAGPARVVDEEWMDLRACGLRPGPTGRSG